MRTSHRILNLSGVLLPFAGLVAAVVLLWETAWVGPSDLAIMAVMYVLTAYEVDPTGWAVRALRRLKLAWNVIEITPERQRQLLAPR